MSDMDSMIKMEMKVTERLARYVDKLLGQYGNRWREEFDRRDRAICDHFRSGGRVDNMPEHVSETLRYLEDLAFLDSLRQEITEHRGGC